MKYLNSISILTLQLIVLTLFYSPCQVVYGELENKF